MNIQVLCYQNFVWVTLFHYYFVLVNVITDLMFICLKVIQSNSYTEKKGILTFDKYRKVVYILTHAQLITNLIGDLTIDEIDVL